MRVVNQKSEIRNQKCVVWSKYKGLKICDNQRNLRENFESEV